MMSHFNTAPPPYDQVIVEEPRGEIKFCPQCGNSCSDLLYCFSCGAAVDDTPPGAVPPPTYTPPKTYAPIPPAYTPQPAPPPPPQVEQPVSYQESQAAAQHQPVYNSANDMSVRIGDRLIYDFEKIACCIGEVVGLDPLVKNNMHPEIQQKGVSPDEWRQWMLEIEDIQKMATSIAGCLCLFCFPGGPAQCILCALFCPISAHHPLSWLPCCYGDWYEGLRNWMRKVNNTLSRLGMYAKLMTYKPFNSAPRSKLYNHRITGKDHNYEMSFLVIALTQAESRRLEDESWDHGVNDQCTSGKGRCL